MADQNKEIPRLTYISGHPDLKHEATNTDTSAATLPLEQDPFYPAFWQNVVETATTIPQGEDPAYWPIRVLLELDELVRYRKPSTYSAGKAALAETLAPIHQTIRNIKTAYSIAAYPHCKSTTRTVSALVNLDQRSLATEGSPRTQFELNDAELTILHSLCQTPRYTYAKRDEHGRHYGSPVKIYHQPIPFDPQRRIFRYSEVPAPRF